MKSEQEIKERLKQVRQNLTITIRGSKELWNEYKESKAEEESHRAERRNLELELERLRNLRLYGRQDP